MINTGDTCTMIRNKVIPCISVRNRNQFLSDDSDNDAKNLKNEYLILENKNKAWLFSPGGC